METAKQQIPTTHFDRRRVADSLNVGYGPMKVSILLLWLIACSLARVMATGAGGPHALLIMAVAWYCLYQFLKLSFEMFVMQTGGTTSLSKLAPRERSKARRRCFFFFFLGVTVVGALVDASTEMKLHSAAWFIFGFDGIVYDHISWVFSITAALTTWFILSMFAEDALGHRVKLLNVFKSMAARAGDMMFALALLVSCYILLTQVQGVVRLSIAPVIVQSEGIVKSVLFLAYVIPFCLLRAFLSVTIVGYAMKRSFLKKPVYATNDSSG